MFDYWCNLCRVRECNVCRKCKLAVIPVRLGGDICFALLWFTKHRRHVASRFEHVRNLCDFARQIMANRTDWIAASLHTRPEAATCTRQEWHRKVRQKLHKKSYGPLNRRMSTSKKVFFFFQTSHFPRAYTNNCWPLEDKTGVTSDYTWSTRTRFENLYSYSKSYS